MARKMRIENAGFHHIINRGVNRGIIFNSTADKEKFLEIVCEVLEHYDFTIHGYAGFKVPHDAKTKIGIGKKM